MVILVRYYGDTWANLTRLHASKPVAEACEAPEPRPKPGVDGGTGDGARNRLSFVLLEFAHNLILHLRTTSVYSIMPRSFFCCFPPRRSTCFMNSDLLLFFHG